MTACDAEFHSCRCGLDEHPESIPHHCTGPSQIGDPEIPCGGMWLDDPRPGWMLVVRYPVEAARIHGVPQPTEPAMEQSGIFGVARGVIKFIPAPSLNDIRAEGT